MVSTSQPIGLEGGSRLAPCPAGRVTLKSWKSEGDRNMSPNVDPQEGKVKKKRRTSGKNVTVFFWGWLKKTARSFPTKIKGSFGFQVQ